MTNTTNVTKSTTNVTKGDNMTNSTITTVNESALISIITANLFHELGCTQKAVVAACSLVAALEHEEYFLETLVYNIESTQVFASLNNKGVTESTKHLVNTHLPVEMDMNKLGASLIKLDYLTEDGGVGAKLKELSEVTVEAYYPIVKGARFERRNPNYKLEHGQKSKLIVEAIEATEATYYTVDQKQLRLANEVETIMSKVKDYEDEEAYVLKGCNKLGDEVYFSEFTADNRGRINQACCHGPNGQSSDRSRSLMNLANVPMDYDIKKVMAVILLEMEDMTSDMNETMNELHSLEEEQFVIKHLNKGTTCKKPWSFVKAARIIKELQAGNRPYIGMAVGLDAKCSGPQLGALMVGDQLLAAACGMSMVQVLDAYELAVVELEKAGFPGFTRSGVKTPFMGIFYGQSWRAFTNLTAMRKEEDLNETVSILAPNGIITDDIAKAFHKAITKSFGKKLTSLRSRILEFTGKIEGRTHHMMPDKFKVQMNYKVKYNILNEEMCWNKETGAFVEAPDVYVQNGDQTAKFIKMQHNSKTVHCDDFIRTTFVNMIQATDALVARMIITKLKRAGAQHIIAVHDCFRVNVTEMHLLEQAIIETYQELFGTGVNTKTTDLPLGLDIIGMLFEGLSESLKEGEKIVPMTQFLPFGPKPRKMSKIGKTKLSDIIDALGTSYYFAK
jgi:hypothetical protein